MLLVDSSATTPTSSSFHCPCRSTHFFLHRSRPAALDSSNKCISLGSRGLGRGPAGHPSLSLAGLPPAVFVCYGAGGPNNKKTKHRNERDPEVGMYLTSHAILLVHGLHMIWCMSFLQDACRGSGHLCSCVNSPSATMASCGGLGRC